jgi:nucleoside-diphosphate kinase
VTVAIQNTFAIIKPDAVAAGNAGKIIDCIEENGFSIVAMKKIFLSKDQAAGFYHVHTERPFFGDLLAFMTSGPVVVMILRAEDAISRWRALMGPTDSTKAEAGTIRGDFGTDIEKNASHGSDATDTAQFETGYFFNAFERV